MGECSPPFHLPFIPTVEDIYDAHTTTLQDQLQSILTTTVAFAEDASDITIIWLKKARKFIELAQQEVLDRGAAETFERTVVEDSIKHESTLNKSPPQSAMLDAWIQVREMLEQQQVQTDEQQQQQKSSAAKKQHQSTTSKIFPTAVIHEEECEDDAAAIGGLINDSNKQFTRSSRVSSSSTGGGGESSWKFNTAQHDTMSNNSGYSFTSQQSSLITNSSAKSSLSRIKRQQQKQHEMQDFIKLTLSKTKIQTNSDNDAFFFSQQQQQNNRYEEKKPSTKYPIILPPVKERDENEYSNIGSRVRADIEQQRERKKALDGQYFTTGKASYPKYKPPPTLTPIDPIEERRRKANNFLRKSLPSALVSNSSRIVVLPPIAKNIVERGSRVINSEEEKGKVQLESLGRAKSLATTTRKGLEQDDDDDEEEENQTPKNDIRRRGRVNGGVTELTHGNKSRAGVLLPAQNSIDSLSLKRKSNRKESKDEEVSAEEERIDGQPSKQSVVRKKARNSQGASGERGSSSKEKFQKRNTDKELIVAPTHKERRGRQEGTLNDSARGDTTSLDQNQETNSEAVVGKSKRDLDNHNQLGELQVVEREGRCQQMRLDKKEHEQEIFLARREADENPSDSDDDLIADTAAATESISTLVSTETTQTISKDLRAPVEQQQTEGEKDELEQTQSATSSRELKHSQGQVEAAAAVKASLARIDNEEHQIILLQQSELDVRISKQKQIEAILNKQSSSPTVEKDVLLHSSDRTEEKVISSHNEINSPGLAEGEGDDSADEESTPKHQQLHLKKEIISNNKPTSSQATASLVSSYTNDDLRARMALLMGRFDGGSHPNEDDGDDISAGNERFNLPPDEEEDEEQSSIRKQSATSSSSITAMNSTTDDESKKSKSQIFGRPPANLSKKDSKEAAATESDKPSNNKRIGAAQQLPPQSQKKKESENSNIGRKNSTPLVAATLIPAKKGIAGTPSQAATSSQSTDQLAITSKNTQSKPPIVNPRKPHDTTLGAGPSPQQPNDAQPPQPIPRPRLGGAAAAAASQTSKLLTKMMKEISDENLIDFTPQIPSFSHLFSGFVNALQSASQPMLGGTIGMNQSTTSSFGGFSLIEGMREMYSMFQTHVERVDNADKGLLRYRTVQTPLEVQPSEVYYQNDPSKVVVYQNRVDIDMRRFVERQITFMQRMNGENFAGHLLPHEEFYFRVVKSKAEVYDIISRAFMRKKDWFELPHGLQLKTSWNLLWTWSKPQIDFNKLLFFQKVNHFPFNKNLVRKDLLKKNFDRIIKLGAKAAQVFNILPLTFVLPKEYCNFSERFYDEAMREGDEKNIWIMKPVGKSQGRGIQLVNDISQVIYAEPVVVQKYMRDPLLLDGYKFDMRIYALVTHMKPLEAYVYREGFARLSTEKYSLNAGNIKNNQVHLTNFSIQKHHYDSSTGNNFIGGTKISLKMLQDKLRQRGIDWDKIWTQVQEIIAKSLLACQTDIPNNPNCFEVFGYDIIIDQSLKCILLEINSSPSLSRDFIIDDLIKQQMVDDAIDLVAPVQFDRLRLLEVLDRRIREEQGNKSTINTTNNSKLQLNRDLNYILRGQKLRAFGETPKNLGHWIKVAPTEMSDKYMKIIQSYKLPSVRIHSTANAANNNNTID